MNINYGTIFQQHKVRKEMLKQNVCKLVIADLMQLMNSVNPFVDGFQLVHKKINE